MSSKGGERSVEWCGSDGKPANGFPRLPDRMLYSRGGEGYGKRGKPKRFPAFSTARRHPLPPRNRFSCPEKSAGKRPGARSCAGEAAPEDLPEFRAKLFAGKKKCRETGGKTVSRLFGFCALFRKERKGRQGVKAVPEGVPERKIQRTLFCLHDDAFLRGFTKSIA